MLFSLEKEGYKFYSNYGKKRVQRKKVKTQRLTYEIIQKCSFFYSKEGFGLENKSCQVRKYKRKEIRIDCNAMFQITHDTHSKKWVIIRIVLEHNYDTNVLNHGHITDPSINCSKETTAIDTTNKRIMLDKTVVGNSPVLFLFVNLSNH